MATTNSSALNWIHRETITAGTSVTIMVPNRSTRTAVAVIPVAGGTMTVEASRHDPNDVASATAGIWETAAISAAAAAATAHIDNPITAIRVSAATQDGTVFLSQ